MVAARRFPLAHPSLAAATAGHDRDVARFARPGVTGAETGEAIRGGA